MYTVVTRAKHNVWLYEDLEPKALPMLDYWHRRGLVQVITSQDNITPYLADSANVESTLEDWKRRGDAYWEQQLWEQARRCYQHAKADYLERLAYATSTAQKALKEKNEKLFLVAAEEFIDCNKDHHKHSYLQEAAGCLFHAKMYRESAQLFEKIQDVSAN